MADREIMSKSHEETTAKLIKRRIDVNNRLQEVSWKEKLLAERYRKVEEQLANVKREKKKLQGKFKSLSDTINAMQDKTVYVTEHAICRYLERQHGIDLNEIIEEMVPEAAVRKIGNRESAPRYIVLEDYALYTRDGKVVTVTSIDEMNENKG